MEFKTLTDVLNAAITKEQISHETYAAFGKQIKNNSAKQLLEDLARQELGHKKMLENALAANNVDLIRGKSKVQDLHLSDYMIVETITPDSDPQQVMLFAMKREEEAYEGYTALRYNYAGTELGGLFSRLADEELKHKTTLEREYEEHFAQWF